MPKHHLTKFTQIPPKSMYTESVWEINRNKLNLKFVFRYI
jgi:hypothetical protein